MNRNLIILIIAIVLTATMVLAENTRSLENTDKTITYLLTFFAKSDCSFIRNGQSYTDKQASNHMQEKARYFKDQIVTPEDFIRLAATESRVTSQPYMVRTKEGNELHGREPILKIHSKNVLLGFDETDIVNRARDELGKAQEAMQAGQWEGFGNVIQGLTKALTPKP
jgi:hypothetical protein